VERELAGLVHEINEAWLGGDLGWLRRHFHPEIVMVAPGFKERVQGADACVRSFEDFLTTAEVRDFRESELVAEAFGPAAVASFRFEIVYALDGRDYRESGRDIWVFARDPDGWKAVWRTQVAVERDG
jgi:ketosteroid isomerase-like protein